MLRTFIGALVFIALSPGFAQAEKESWGLYADYDNVYNSQTDVNEYIVFAQSTWGMLWYWDEQEQYDYIQVGNERYETVPNGLFFESVKTEHPIPTARLWKKNGGGKCVISFRPSIGGEIVNEAWGTIASEANYPVEGVVTGFWHHDNQPDGSRIDTYYYRVLQAIGGSIDNAVRSASCSEVVATGWSMGGALAQLYAYRSWVEANSPQVGEVYAFNPGPAGNGKFRTDYNNMASSIGVKSETFCRIKDPVMEKSRLAYFDPSQVNWELGCGDKLGVQMDGVYEMQGKVPVNHDLRAWRTCGLHGIDRDKQCPSGVSEAVPWSSSNPVRGTEGAYLNNFVYTTGGAQPDGYSCVKLDPWSGSKNKDDYKDNYFCSWQEIGMEWSTTGPVSGKVCTRIDEPADKNSDGSSSFGENNYLCIQQDSSYKFTWTTNNSTSGKHCVQWYETKRPSWTDNYLCWITDNDTVVGGGGENR